MKKRTVKKTLIILSLIAIGAIMAFTTSCSGLSGTTKTARIEAFVDDLNSSYRSGISTNFSSLSTLDSTTFNSGSWAYTWQPFTVSNITESGSYAYATISNSLGSQSFTFTMTDEGSSGFLSGEDWKIISISPISW